MRNLNNGVISECGHYTIYVEGNRTTHIFDTESGIDGYDFVTEKVTDEDAEGAPEAPVEVTEDKGIQETMGDLECQPYDELRRLRHERSLFMVRSLIEVQLPELKPRMLQSGLITLATIGGLRDSAPCWVGVTGGGTYDLYNEDMLVISGGDCLEVDEVLRQLREHADDQEHQRRKILGVGIAGLNFYETEAIADAIMARFAPGEMDRGNAFDCLEAIEESGYTIARNTEDGFVAF